MLMGYLKCSFVNKILISYINFELDRNISKKVALHLRNCPICMEKYSKYKKRQNELKTKLKEIEKRTRIENEISLYIDNALSSKQNAKVELALQYDENYILTYKKYLELKEILFIIKKEISNNKDTSIARKICAKIKLKNKKINSLKQIFIRPAQFLCRLLPE